ncbi:11816_t:CDS:1, partial [Gigaspora rosea]
LIQPVLIEGLKENLSYVEQDLVFYIDGTCKIEHELDIQKLGIE